MPVGLEAWFNQVPPVTRAWISLCVVLSLAVQCQLVTPLQLYFSFKAAFSNGQPWRIITTFLYFGPISLDFVFHLFFFMRYSRMLEDSNYAHKRAEYLWLLISSSFMLLLLSPLVTMPFLSSSLAFVPIYLWSRRHPDTQISLFGLVTITAPYLPLALVCFSWLLNGSWRAAAADLMGCAVGHVCWFTRDVWAREMSGANGFWNEAPEGLKRLLGDPL
ncbi:Der1-like protein [Sistotremastrum niveocremeum HHB9708]|uniref:Derlin n=2 Tax=Sistotremastraceae TaxID=3402574 RepID=A0A164UUP8_9AGAM|nr:Der1-like protein [Sistotremastrum niveocremeum HHB9708]KZT42671.1 Der1-like protein [Sistotremastrum suecicum HHB10207 ss-3]